MKHIVVGVDDSPGGAAALRVAVELAEATDAQITAVHALGLLESIGQSYAPFPAEPFRVAIQHRFEQLWCAPLNQATVHNRRIVRDGPSALVLMRVADETEADLIVVGRRARSRGACSTLGSTSFQLASEARQPVLVVP